MAFMENVWGEISQASQSTVQKAKNMSEIARLNNVITGAEKQINELYGQIGYAVYCAYQNHSQPEIKEQIEQLNALHKGIEECNEQIKAIKAADSCPQCGAKIVKGKAFCASCGYKLPVAEQPVAAPAAAFCSNCGSPVASGTLFCASCGQKVG